MLRHLPNLITIIRFLLVPVLVVLLLNERYFPAFFVFVVAALSDGIDGFIARRYCLESHLGGILDPLADKAMMAASYIMLAVLGLVPIWAVAIILGRDALIIGGYLGYTRKYGPIQMKASLLSKANSVAQMAFATSVLAHAANLIDFAHFAYYFLYGTVGLTIVSGIHYYWSWIIAREVRALDANKHIPARGGAKN